MATDQFPPALVRPTTKLCVRKAAGDRVFTELTDTTPIASWLKANLFAGYCNQSRTVGGTNVTIIRDAEVFASLMVDLEFLAPSEEPSVALSSRFGENPQIPEELYSPYVRGRRALTGSPSAAFRFGTHLMTLVASCMQVGDQIEIEWSEFAIRESCDLRLAVAKGHNY